MPKHKRKQTNHRTQSRSHTRRTARVFDSDLRSGSLAAIAANSPEAPPPPPPTPINPLAVNQMRWSVDLTRRVLHAALTLACDHAQPDDYCYRATKGVCRDRYLRGQELVAAEEGPRRPLEPGELQPLAKAQRQAWRAASFREKGRA